MDSSSCRVSNLQVIPKSFPKLTFAVMPYVKAATTCQAQRGGGMRVCGYSKAKGVESGPLLPLHRTAPHGNPRVCHSDPSGCHRPLGLLILVKCQNASLQDLAKVQAAHTGHQDLVKLTRKLKIRQYTDTSNT